MTAMDYPIALAAEDFVPVLLITAGVVLLRRLARAPATTLLTVAAALICAGGLAKSTWKLIVAAGGADLTWLEALLFPCQTAGFGVLSLALAAHRGGTRPPRWLSALVPGLAAACGAGAMLAGGMRPLVLSTAVFATVAAVYLIVLARDRGDTVAAGLFGIQLLGMFGLSQLSGVPEQTVALQWIEQSINTAAQAAFLLAAWRVSRTHRTMEAIR
ncbi:hypothetical protein ACIA8C_19480 [Nocardia sp. NPDC051321]|uniref:hypothetical protein n=1 Tax=Nocardia sp. NPDC051321 TaxID=3364323 RepID=UPI00378F9C23